MTCGQCSQNKGEENMAQIVLKVLDKDGNILCEKSGKDEVVMVYAGEYQEGDCCELEVDEVNTFYYVQFDDVKGKSLVYLTGKVRYAIPFGDKAINTSPRLFKGDKHLLCVSKMQEEEKDNYRNLSENVWDQHGEVNCYPHASANVETRGESVFAALNAIDGVLASENHGAWPYESWGINRRDDAAWKLEFGRPVDVDKIAFYSRADFPHDNWWVNATLTFSDGSKEVLDLVKTGEAQYFDIKKKGIEWIVLDELIKADDPSPFPALIQLKVYGRG
jgi:hypothetical protein